MATRLTFSIVLLLMLMTGCAQQSMVAQLPAPNFDAPKIAALPAPVTPKPIDPAPARTVARSDVPAAWVPSSPARPWRWIVIHHSATTGGGARRFDQMHREKGWDELGYHFVIGNGTDTGDGQVEVGSRWPRQKHGAHAKTPDNRFNDYGIGVCFVGNFDTGRPTPAQYRSAAKLVAYLMRTYNVPPDRILGHQDTGRATECPGRLMRIAEIKRLATQMLAEADVPAPDALAQGGELLIDTATK